MITKKTRLSACGPSLSSPFFSAKESVFFDIETTGLSPSQDIIYLVGAVMFIDNDFYLCQWFCESLTDEKDLLVSFFSAISGKKAIIHFNGDAFDIPFVQKRASAHGLCFDTSGFLSLDIYRILRPHKKLFGLADLKQKSIEKFAGINRDDTLSGGELIKVYGEYLLCRDAEKLSLLLLHNFDDVKGLFCLAPFINLSVFKDKKAAEACLEENALESVSVDDGLFCVRLHADLSLPCGFSLSKAPWKLEFSPDGLFLSAEIYTGELKLYYKNYNDYYYLPAEDMAVHKSVGAFVSPASRKKATASTCYTRVCGSFVPDPTGEKGLRLDTEKDPAFCSHSGKKNTQGYMALDDVMKADRETKAQYALDVLLNIFC